MTQEQIKLLREIFTVDELNQMRFALDDALEVGITGDAINVADPIQTAYAKLLEATTEPPPPPITMPIDVTGKL